MFEISLNLFSVKLAYVFLYLLRINSFLIVIYHDIFFSNYFIKLRIIVKFYYNISKNTWLMFCNYILTFHHLYRYPAGMILRNLITKLHPLTYLNQSNNKRGLKLGTSGIWPCLYEIINLDHAGLKMYDLFNLLITLL